MSITDTVKSDLVAAMKAGERERVGTLRLVLSELQKAAKEGSDDELAVLRRERKRRAEAERAFRDGGREDLADAEAAEARIIAGYLPAELDDAELDAIVAPRGRAVGRADGQGSRQGDADRDGRGRRTRRRQAGLRAGASGARGRVRRQFELPNDLAARARRQQRRDAARARAAPRRCASSCAATC